MSFVEFSREEVNSVRRFVPGLSQGQTMAAGMYRSIAAQPQGFDWQDFSYELSVNTNNIVKYYRDNDNFRYNDSTVLTLKTGEEFLILLKYEEVKERILKAHLDPEMLSVALQYALVALDKLQERN